MTMNKLWLAPHPDDETLFGAFTLMREKPLVLIVTDSWVQFNRGETCTAEDRWQETLEAMKMLGCPVVRGGIRDDVIDEWMVRNLLSKFDNFDMVYAPAIQGGNPHHDLIGKIARDIWTGDKVRYYTTYTKENLYTKGTEEVVPTPEELALKEKALACYKSQLKINKPHFDAVLGRSEWYL
jgi:LmbE family N-acetylglucosaminyl deacetylase